MKTAKQVSYRVVLVALLLGGAAVSATAWTSVLNLKFNVTKGCSDSSCAPGSTECGSNPNGCTCNGNTCANLAAQEK
jgi:hypothetical protein